MLMRYDPFRELDRLAQQTLSAARPAVMAMDAWREGSQFVVRFDLPGIAPDSIDLTVERNVLTVTAERAWASAEEVQVVVAERPQGRFSRQLFLGESLDTDNIQASYDGGVLTIIIPVAEQAKARKVSLNVGHGGPEAVDTTASEHARETDGEQVGIPA